MSTKENISTLVNTDLASDQPVIATQHRNVLKDSVDSILNNMYADEVIDTEATETHFTLATAGSATFTFRFLKQGRKVTINGVVTSLTGTIVNLGTINVGEFEALVGQTYSGTGIVAGTQTVNSVAISDTGGTTTLKFKASLTVGQTINFGITYNCNT